jgi:ubiquinone/menaquinone biosynthesis C-methylase UbiE
MKNRYDALLREQHAAIVQISPPSRILWHVAGYEMNRRLPSRSRILELGGGYADSTLPILEHTDAYIDVIDISQDMVQAAKKALHAFAKRTNVECADAYTYLVHAPHAYDGVYSSFTLHNFIRADKMSLISAMYAALKPGGICVTVDIIPSKDDTLLLKRLLSRYHYLPEPLATEIIAHTQQDASPSYRMNERWIIDIFKKVGFSRVELIDRIEREAIIIATK